MFVRVRGICWLLYLSRYCIPIFAQKILSGVRPTLPHTHRKTLDLFCLLHFWFALHPCPIWSEIFSLELSKALIQLFAVGFTWTAVTAANCFLPSLRKCKYRSGNRSEIFCIPRPSQVELSLRPKFLPTWNSFATDLFTPWFWFGFNNGCVSFCRSWWIPVWQQPLSSRWWLTRAASPSNSR